MPRPNSFSWRSLPSTKAPNTHTMISAAAVMTRAVAARPSATASALSPVRSNSSFIRGQEEHLVVHRQTEHDREQHHRRPGLDRTLLADAEQAGTPAPLEDGDDHAVGGAHRQQVHDHGLQRHEHAPEHGHQQQEREHQDGTDQDRQPRTEVLGEVDAAGGEPTDAHVEPGGGHHVVAEPIDQLARGLVLRRRVVGYAVHSQVPGAISVPGEAKATPGSAVSAASTVATDSAVAAGSVDTRTSGRCCPGRNPRPAGRRRGEPSAPP